MPLWAEPDPPMAVMEDRFGGYKCEFVSGGSTPPNHLACSHCNLLLRDSCIVDCCGARYCETCVNHLGADGQPCNVCKRQLGKAELDANLQRQVLDQKVNIFFGTGLRLYKLLPVVRVCHERRK